MEKEKVLEIKIVKMNDEWSSCCITHQNEEVLKRGEFEDKELGVYSRKEFCFSYGSFYIRGSEEEMDNKVIIIRNEEVGRLLDLVEKINKKYGIPKRWRGERSDKYFSIFGDNEISKVTDNYFPEDQRRYEWGNYFKTEEEAQKVKAELDKFWAKVRAGEIGGDEQ